MSTSGDVQYIGGCSVHQRDIMIHVGEQLDKILSISIENSDVLKSPDVVMISPDVLMISSQYTHGIPQCTEHLPMYSWYPPTCIMIFPNVLNIPDVLMIFPRCTYGFPPMY